MGRRIGEGRNEGEGEELRGEQRARWVGQGAGASSHPAEDGIPMGWGPTELGPACPNIAIYRPGAGEPDA